MIVSKYSKSNSKYRMRRTKLGNELKRREVGGYIWGFLKSDIR